MTSFTMPQACWMSLTADQRGIISGFTTFSSTSFGLWLGVVSMAYLDVILPLMISRLYEAKLHRDLADLRESSAHESRMRYGDMNTESYSRRGIRSMLKSSVDV